MADVPAIEQPLKLAASRWGAPQGRGILSSPFRTIVGAVFALLGTAGVVALAYVPDWIRPILGVAALAGSWAVLSLGFRPAAHLALLAGLLLCAAAALPGGWWPLPLVVALVGYEVAGRYLPSLRRPTNWLQAGRITSGTWALILGIAAISGVALVIWAATADPDWERYRGNFPDFPVPLLVLGALAFSVVNAAAEEAAFRGIVQGAVGEAIGARAALIVQAAAFGLLHIEGFPSGLPGVLLATTYGLAIGALRSHAGGLLAPWLAHVAADAVIVSVLLFVLFA